MPIKDVIKTQAKELAAALFRYQNLRMEPREELSSLGIRLYAALCFQPSLTALKPVFTQINQGWIGVALT